MHHVMYNMKVQSMKEFLQVRFRFLLWDCTKTESFHSFFYLSKLHKNIASRTLPWAVYECSHWFSFANIHEKDWKRCKNIKVTLLLFYFYDRKLENHKILPSFAVIKLYVLQIGLSEDMKWN